VRSRAPWILALLASGCGIPLLPTTLFYAPMGEEEATSPSAWSALLARAPAARGSSSVVASEPLGSDEWLVWMASSATDASRVEGSLVRARRTPRGLEAQAIGPHVGPAIRATLRGIRIDGVTIAVIESSIGERSIERSAWIYVARDGVIQPAELDGGASVLAMHRETSGPVDERWDRERTVTATLEGAPDALIVHEHATVREVARNHPEIPARGVREIDRDRRLVLDGRRLVADRPSLFDEP
jgi:hypothetical protein